MDGPVPTVKVSVGYLAGYIGEGEIGYAGRNALGRATLPPTSSVRASEERLARCALTYRSTSLHGRSFDAAEQPYEIRLRMAARAKTRRLRACRRGGRALYTNGPAGGGGVRTSVHEQIGIVSTLIDRARVVPRVTIREWAGYAEAV